MAKCDESFKLAMVQKYLGGEISNKALAEQAGLHASLLRQWTNSYQGHGIEGLRKKFIRYSVS
ncbi:helix-turn-helix domain-containing protein [Comamonas squillarum]|uniref:helix-turn-helix domain-containing protein n=1 Tax=Comamonas squillarum TaxID=2977320 RepID=UPI00391F9698